MGGFSPGQVKLLSAGRVLDTTRLVERAKYRPRFTTIEAFDDFAAGLRPALAPSTVRRVEVRIASTLGAQPLPAVPAQATSRRGLSGSAEVIDATSDDQIDPIADPLAADELSLLDDQRIGRPRLVGITGDGAGSPRRRRFR
jgi:UDP-glucose 4-epimerase